MSATLATARPTDPALSPFQVMLALQYGLLTPIQRAHAQEQFEAIMATRDRRPAARPSRSRS